ncbi:MAG TPA: hypothetical protein VJQ82_25470 [Terriglobales bacterium]|nr:hypothetical protein [Terriglobales bacterium]
MRQRWIARLLLLLMVVGVMAPAALAFTSTSLHACCARKGMHCHSPRERQVQTPGCCGHDCCRSMVTAHWAQSTVYRGWIAGTSRGFVHALPALNFAMAPDLAHAGRAPPTSFLA